MVEDLRRYWPTLPGHVRITSDATSAYNCIAWALEDTSRKWEPGIWVAPYFWPRELGTDRSASAWVRLFQLHGYTLCHTDEIELESGYEKVAIYVSPNAEPTHVARQVESGAWTSKLGNLEEIEHPSLNDLVGDEYGQVGPVLKRPRISQDESP